MLGANRSSGFRSASNAMTESLPSYVPEVASPLPTAYSNRPLWTVPPPGVQMPPSREVGTAYASPGPLPEVGIATTEPT